MKNINYKWCSLSDMVLLDELVALFVRNVDNHYISHGEVMYGRADDMQQWKTEIKTIMTGEFSKAMHHTFEGVDTFTILGVALENETIIALSLVEFYPQTKVAVLCDMVVDAPLRGQNIGKSLFDWIQDQVKIWGAKFIFLESGIENKSAHHFFENMGFRNVSVVMAKEMIYEIHHCR